MIKKTYSWTRVNTVKANFLEPQTKTEVKKLIKNKKEFLTFGNGRSYGDVCLNNKNLISMRKFNKILFYKSILLIPQATRELIYYIGI